MRPHRAPAKKSSPRSRQATPTRTPFWRVQARDLWAVGLITFGVLLALALWGQQLGPVGHGADAGLADLAGWARVLLPLVAVGAGLTLLIDRGGRADDEDAEGADPWRLAVGTVLGLLGVCGLAEVAKGAPPLSASHSLRDAGGYLGAIVGRPLHAGLGPAGAAVLLVAVVLVAILIATGVSLAALGRSLHVAATSTARTAKSLWMGKPFVIAPDHEAGNAAPPAAVPADETDLHDEPDAEEMEIERDVDIDIPLEPEPEQEPVALAPLAASAPRAPGEWVLPSMSLLLASKKLRQDQRQIDAAGAELVRSLAAHGVETRLVGSRVGPTVTRYEIELGPGVKVARVTSLSKDIAYAMASPDVRILAPIPGKSAIGVEVPNRTRQLVSLRDILESKEAKPSPSTHPLEVAMGRDIAGRAVMANLAEMPHILISGATGSGKSSCMNSIITSILMRDTPDKVKMILVDPKRVELGQYDGLPHLLNPVVVDPKKAANALAWAVKEMERRYDLLAENGVRDITGYNQLVLEGLIAPPPTDRSQVRAVAARALGEDHPAVEDEADLDEPDPPETLPFILVVVDELNDLMMVAARDVEDSIVRIAQMARAVGIHLVIATQRPSVDVITGVIKANIPSRMAFSVSSLADSRVILDQPGAERLIGKGDMLLLTASSNIPRRLQAPWVSEEEVREVVGHWRAQGGQTEAIVGIEGIDDGPTGSGGVDDDDDELLVQARDLVVRSQLGSTSMLQRKLRVGFARAGRLMDLLERAGVVGPSEGSKARAVLMTPEELDALEPEVSEEDPAPLMVAPFRLDSLRESAPSPSAPTEPQPGERGRHAVRSERRRRRRHIVVPLVTLIVLLAAGAAFAGVRLRSAPPTPLVTPVLKSEVPVQSQPVSLPWPATGQAAVAVPTLGIDVASGAEQPVPVASLTKLMTAYVILRDHPLAGNGTGPTIGVTQADIDDYDHDTVSDDSNALVNAGEQLTEQQLLSGMLVHSADNYADLLARWDAGTTTAFVAKMNAAAADLGMAHSHFDDASGIERGIGVDRVRHAEGRGTRHGEPHVRFHRAHDVGHAARGGHAVDLYAADRPAGHHRREVRLHRRRRGV